MITKNTIHTCLFQNNRAKAHPRVVKFVYLHKGTKYTTVSPWLGTMRVQSYQPGRDVRSAVVCA